MAAGSPKRRAPRDSQRARIYAAEHPLPSSPLPGLGACATFADKVVGTLWWHARFPALTLDRIPRLRPGHGARQAFYREDPDGPTITLPRRYRTKGVMLHELGHWAMSDDPDLPNHGSTFARLLLDLTAEYAGPARARALAESYEERKVRLGAPPLAGPDGHLRYGWDERLRRCRHQPLLVRHRNDGGDTTTVGIYEGRERRGSVLRFSGGPFGGEPVRVPLTGVWDVRPPR